VVLNGVVGSSLQELGDLRPFVSALSVHQEEDPLLLLAPRNLLNLRIQVVVPSLSALFADPTWQMLSNYGPFLRAIFLH